MDCNKPPEGFLQTKQLNDNVVCFFSLLTCFFLPGLRSEQTIPRCFQGLLLRLYELYISFSFFFGGGGELKTKHSNIFLEHTSWYPKNTNKIQDLSKMNRWYVLDFGHFPQKICWHVLLGKLYLGTKKNRKTCRGGCPFAWSTFRKWNCLPKKKCPPVLWTDRFFCCQKKVPVVEVENLNITALVAEKMMISTWWFTIFRLTSWICRYPIIYDGFFRTIPFPVVGNGISNEPSTVTIPNLDDTRTWSQWISWKRLLGLEVSNRGHHFFQHVNRWVLEKRDPCKLNYPVRWLKIILEALWGVSSSTWRIIPGLGDVLVVYFLCLFFIGILTKQTLPVPWCFWLETWCSRLTARSAC